MKELSKLHRLLDEITLRSLEVGGSALARRAKREFAPAIELENIHKDALAQKQAEIGALRIMAVIDDRAMIGMCNQVLEMGRRSNAKTTN